MITSSEKLMNKRPNLPNQIKPRPGLMLLVLIGAVLFLTAACRGVSPAPQPENYSTAAFVEHLDRRLPALMERYQVPGAAVALVEEGRMVWSGGYGYADLAQGIKMTPATHCRAQSIAKSVTAWGVIKLVEEGQIDLDRPVSEYLTSWDFPGNPDHAGEVTVRQLLTHTGGVQRGTVGVHYGPEENRPSLYSSLDQEVRFRHRPGETFLYSNPGYNVLEVLVEDVTGRSFADYMKREVLLPLGMQRADFEWQPDWRPGAAVGYDVQGDPVPVYVYPEKASGGLFATVGDLAAFAAAAAGEPSSEDQAVLDPAAQRLLYTPQAALTGQYRLISESYGLGHFIDALQDGRSAVWHGGQGHGWMTHFHAVPGTGQAIVILTNSQRSWPVIARVLRDWSAWNGFGPAGMELIITGSRAVSGLAGLIFSAAAWGAVRLGREILSRKRQFGPHRLSGRLRNLIRIGAGLILSGGLVWFFSQEYTFFSVVFPLSSRWLGFSLGAAAVLLICRGLFPRTS
jgi:CubicO group peptidase (beta-lactamase class C family)